MKIRELFEDGDHYLFATHKQPHKPRQEGPMSKMASTASDAANYTPGKAALDREYEETEDHTRTSIPNKQTKLDDPRQ
jgi:hypothetical protein